MKLRLFEAFAGYGSQSLALKRYGIEYEHVGICEIDKYAIKAHEALHGPVKNFGDISKVNPISLPDMDLFTYSFPCQDISVAGRGKGLEESSGTRSSLLWECRKVIVTKRPKVLMLENVKNLVGKKNRPYFEKWLTWLEAQGYNNYWEVNNAKMCGVPQNRERVFVVSILSEFDDGTFKFNEPFDNGIRLKHILDHEVDEKYYIDESKTKNLIMKLINEGKLPRTLPAVGHHPFSKTYEFNGYDHRLCPALLATDYKAPKTVLESIPGAIRGRNPNQPQSIVRDLLLKQVLEIKKDDISTYWPSVSYKPMPGKAEIKISEWTGCLGLEPTLEMYIGHLVLIFREVWKVLKPEGSLWINLGDTYCSTAPNSYTTPLHISGLKVRAAEARAKFRPFNPNGMKPKDRMGVPWHVAFALQADGWYLRQENIWEKPNCLPESVRDRTTTAHETVFHLTKNRKYYYDKNAVAERSVTGDNGSPRGSRGVRGNKNSGRRKVKKSDGTLEMKNKRSVWKIATKPAPDTNYAMFPPALVAVCILSSCPLGGIVLDPFAGRCTVADVAPLYDRGYICIELKDESCKLSQDRLSL